MSQKVVLPMENRRITLNFDERESNKLSEDIINDKRRRAESGDPQAQFEIGKIIQDNIHAEEDKEEAFSFFESSAMLGDANGMFELAQCYHLGFGIEKNITEAATWYYVAAKKGNPEACICLGFLYENGVGIDKAEHLAESWLGVAARDFHNPIAFRCLGKLFLKYAQQASARNMSTYEREFTTQLHPQSIVDHQSEDQILEKLSQLRLELRNETEKMEFDEFTQEIMQAYNKSKGTGYYNPSLGIRFKGNKVIEVMRGSDADEKGVQPGCIIISIDGVNVEKANTSVVGSMFKKLKDERRIFEIKFLQRISVEELLKQSKDLISTGAKLNDSESDLILSRWCYQETSKLSNNDKSSQLLLREKFPRTQFLFKLRRSNIQPKMEKNGTLSDIHLRKAALHRNPEAWFELGCRAMVGENFMDKYNTTAINYFLGASNLGSIDGMKGAAHCYIFGEGGLLEKDATSAYEMWKQAGDLGDSDSVRNCAECRYQGIGVNHDVILAKELYKKAASMNNSRAMVWMGSALIEEEIENSEEIIQDDFQEQTYKRAISYLQQAASVGEPEAFYHLGVCYLKGLGVSVDLIRGRNYLREARSLGFDAADDVLLSVGDEI